MAIVKSDVKAQANTALNKSVKNELAHNMLADHMRDYLRDSKNFKEALSMVKKTGFLINELQIPKLLENSNVTKERFKLIYDTQSFEHPISSS